MKNSPRTTIMGLLIALVILFVFVNWHVFRVATGPSTDAMLLHEVAKILIAVFVFLLGFFAMDEVTH